MIKRNLFRERVIRVVKGIKRGKVMTYKEVAARAGHPGAARAVGAIMRVNKDKSMPCHRVIRSDARPNGLAGRGTVGGYNGLQGTKSKLALLRREGVKL